MSNTVKLLAAGVAVVVLGTTLVFVTGCGETAPEPGESAPIAQKTCPVMGGKIDPKIYTDHEGRRIYFCCAACPPKFKEDPEKYLTTVDAEIAGAESTGAGHGKH